MSKQSQFIIGGIIAVVVVGGGFLIIKNNASYEKKTTTTNKATQTITLGSTGASFPSSYKSGDKLVGFDVEVAQKAAKLAGYRVKWVNADFDGLWGQLDTNRVQGIANAVSFTPERQAKYQFTNAYYNDEAKVAVPTSSKAKKLSDLDNQKVAGVAGSNNITALQSVNKSIVVAPFENRDSATQAVLSEKVAGVVNSGPILSATIKKNHLKLRLLPDTIQKTKVGIVFKKDDAGKKYAKSFNKAFVELAKQGEIEKLSKQYFGYDVSNHDLEK